MELALVSLATRIDQHVITMKGGAHVGVKGWHAMYVNNVSAVMKTANWCAANTENNSSDSEEELEDELSDDENDDEEFENDVLAVWLVNFLTLSFPILLLDVQ